MKKAAAVATYSLRNGVWTFNLKNYRRWSMTIADQVVTSLTVNGKPTKADLENLYGAKATVVKSGKVMIAGETLTADTFNWIRNCIVLTASDFAHQALRLSSTLKENRTGDEMDFLELSHSLGITGLYLLGYFHVSPTDLSDQLPDFNMLRMFYRQHPALLNQLNISWQRLYPAQKRLFTMPEIMIPCLPETVLKAAEEQPLLTIQ